MSAGISSRAQGEHIRPPEDRPATAAAAGTVARRLPWVSPLGWCAGSRVVRSVWSLPTHAMNGLCGALEAWVASRRSQKRREEEYARKMAVLGRSREVLEDREAEAVARVLGYS